MHRIVAVFFEHCFLRMRRGCSLPNSTIDLHMRKHSINGREFLIRKEACMMIAYIRVNYKIFVVAYPVNTFDYFAARVDSGKTPQLAV